MKICITYCKNCGAEYKWQASGSYNALDIPNEYQDSEYCPECKKTIIEALSKIEKKTEITYIKTDEITLDKLLDIEKENLRKNPCRRIFANLYDTKANEHSESGEVKYDGKTYHYFYFPSRKNETKITKKVRLDIKTNNIITDIFKI
ncbi:hypothetical protein M0Q97_04265 [Candidatus Dojkabacteria bacterium]|jgi:hypothetical protein|nr:hypothetical protein [Candidatus Dojkabacteria bacterium]